MVSTNCYEWDWIQFQKPPLSGVIKAAEPEGLNLFPNKSCVDFFLASAISQRNH